jgi:hypothetical protein
LSPMRPSGTAEVTTCSMLASSPGASLDMPAAGAAAAAAQIRLRHRVVVACCDAAQQGLCQCTLFPCNQASPYA